MASQDDRKPIRAIQGIGSTISMFTVPANHTDRWKKNPIPIPIPTQVGHSAVKNPYTQIGAPTSTATRTNLTARQTLLNGTIAPRKTVRDAGSKSYLPSSSSARTKRKGRASASSEPQRPTSHEIIDIDAEHISTDDLDLIADPPPTTSTYFDSKYAGLRKDETESPTVGPSLIADGENTRLLQVKLSEAEPGSRSSSPIETFPEDEAGKESASDTTKPRSKVLERVALFEAKSQVPGVPVYDFKRRKFKMRMQPKGGNAVQKPSSQLASDPLSKSPGRSNNVHSKTWSARLPISMLLIGVQQLPEYDTIVFEKNGAAISFESPSLSNRPIGPILISHRTFSELQYSDPQKIEPHIHQPIFYLRSAENATFGPWQSNFSGVFQPGRNNMGQLSVQFDTNSGKWDGNTYKTSMDRLGRFVEKRSALRTAASKVLWNSLKGNIKYCSDSLHRSDIMTNGEKRKQRSPGLSEPASEPFMHDENHEPEVAESSSAKQRVEDLKKFRHASDDRGIPSSRKRVSPRHQKQDPGEIPEVEPLPRPKRQRTEEPKPLRRSTRQQEKAPINDPDEIVLVYPFGVPGAVNVTTSDLARLQPEEFLNDTLIEFGLKSWLKTFEATNPELASQVHVFNSFFYKKLNKRNIKEGYDSVRKWTSKIDIFSKKYIIVPINEHLHWYLALICEPEHILQPPPPSLTPHTTTVTRLQAREMRTADDMADFATRSTPEPQRVPGIAVTEDNADEDMQDETSETEVERLAFSTSCSVTTTKENSSTTSSAEDMKEELVKASSVEATPGSPMKVDLDIPTTDAVEPSSGSATSNLTMDSGANTPIEIPDDSQPPPMPVEFEVTPARFYGKPYTSKMRKKKIRDSTGELIVIDGCPEDSQPRTKVFIMDSLGNRHPQAMKQLSKWLELEAMDKKNVENVTPAIAKMAPVPVQPNYCDCGLYILHFAATFMSDPQRYSQIIMTKERPSMPERQADWKDASVATMRDDLQHKIIVFSEEWRRWRAAREENQQGQQKAEEEDEDSDVAIVEHVKASGKKSKSSRSTRTKS